MKKVVQYRMTDHMIVDDEYFEIDTITGESFRLRHMDNPINFVAMIDGFICYTEDLWQDATPDGENMIIPIEQSMGVKVTYDEYCMIERVIGNIERGVYVDRS